MLSEDRMVKGSAVRFLRRTPLSPCLIKDRRIARVKGAE
jgi:hypothetical protein